MAGRDVGKAMGAMVLIDPDRRDLQKNQRFANSERQLDYDTREDRLMGDHKSGPEEGVKGVVEGIKGKVKEVGGTVTGRDDIVREGKAQQDKADAQRDVAKKEGEAEAARAGAKAAEERQKEHQ